MSPEVALLSFVARNAAGSRRAWRHLGHRWDRWCCAAHRRQGEEDYQASCWPIPLEEPRHRAIVGAPNLVQIELRRRMATETRTMKAAAAAPHKAHSHQAKLETGGTTGQMGPPPLESLEQSFVTSAIHNPTPTPTTTAVARVRCGMRVIRKD